MATNEVLVFPRTIFSEEFSLLPWDAIQEKLVEIERSFSWLPRPDAELSTNMVQAIPCTFIRDRAGRYCVLRRISNTREDLDEKLSLIVGGHIDEPHDDGSFQAAMSFNLMRELDEEIGIGLANGSPRPVGVIIDNSSIQASRHVAFMHETQADQVFPKAWEEFKAGNPNYSGRFMPASGLVEKHDEFDPWSRLLIEEYICPGDVEPQPRQYSFL